MEDKNRNEPLDEKSERSQQEAAQPGGWGEPVSPAGWEAAAPGEEPRPDGAPDAPGHGPAGQEPPRQEGWAPGGYQAQPPGGYTPPNGGYQYNTASGWQSPSGGEGPGEYQWNFTAYESHDQGAPRRKHRGGLAVLATLGSVALITLTGFAGYGIWSMIQNASRTVQGDSSSAAPAPDSTPKPDANAPQLVLNDTPYAPEIQQSGGRLTTKQIAQRVKPSVVGVVQYITSGAGGTNQGSGIIMSADGYIVTNAHVVEGGNEGITVVLDNGEMYQAQLIGRDEKTDLAVLKIEEENLSYAEFGTSSSLEIGEPVVAIGNPGGVEFAGSVTQGCVSGLNRSIPMESGFTLTCIQTDAAINPGNSGGPLVNEFGQVIGINSSKIVYTGYEGLGFAIPVDDAQPVINDLIQYGYVKGRVKLGITGRGVDPARAQMFRYPLGVEIVTVEPDSPMAGANVVSGDIIVSIGDMEINGMGSLRDALDQYAPGDKVSVGIFRKNGNQIGGKETTITITLLEDTGGQ